MLQVSTRFEFSRAGHELIEYSPHPVLNMVRFITTARMKRIGILDLGAAKSTKRWAHYLGLPEKKQYVSVTPQAIAVWCRQLGHSVYYAAYYGAGEPKAKLPNDLDVVFISAHSNLAPLAYALSKLYKREGTLTVIGGPHAKSFPRDALRYFDLVVLECDKALVRDIVEDRFRPCSIISSSKPYQDTPTIEERLPEIRASVFLKGKPFVYSLIPMLASMGCPYTCNFCTDWNNPYRPLSADRLREDLRFASERLPGVKLIFYDPNFGIRFDETLALFETITPDRRSPYSIETSLTTVRSADRLKRLRDTHCLAIAPGIESWTQYSNKAGVGKATARDKLDQVVDHLHTIHEYVPYIQTNFIFGLDTDSGDEPFELTKEFLLRAPFAFPTLNIPMAFGGTPLFDTLLREGRLLRKLPFTFYVVPYLTLILKNYDPIAYFSKMLDLYSVLFSRELLLARGRTDSPVSVKIVNYYRSLVFYGIYRAMQDTLRTLQNDRQFLEFHSGTSDVLPDLYALEYKKQLGIYAELMPLEESEPLLDDQTSGLVTQPEAIADKPGNAAGEFATRVSV